MFIPTETPFRRLAVLLSAALLTVSPLVPAASALAKTGGEEAAVTKIRAAWERAQTEMSEAGRDGQPTNSFTVEVYQMWPGSGPHREKTTFFFTLDEPDESGRERNLIWQNKLYFVRSKYNVGGREYHDEYLFDRDRPGELLFCLTRLGGAEARYWFAGGKLLRRAPEKSGSDLEHSPEEALGAAKSLYAQFEAVIGREH